MRYYFILISVSDIRMMDNNDIGKEYEKKTPQNPHVLIMGR